MSITDSKSQKIIVKELGSKLRLMSFRLPKLLCRSSFKSRGISRKDRVSINQARKINNFSKPSSSISKSLTWVQTYVLYLIFR